MLMEKNGNVAYEKSMLIVNYFPLSLICSFETVSSLPVGAFVWLYHLICICTHVILCYSLFMKMPLILPF